MFLLYVWDWLFAICQAKCSGLTTAQTFLDKKNWANSLWQCLEIFKYIFCLSQAKKSLCSNVCSFTRRENVSFSIKISKFWHYDACSFSQGFNHLSLPAKSTISLSLILICTTWSIINLIWIMVTMIVTFPIIWYYLKKTTNEHR